MNPEWPIVWPAEWQGPAAGFVAYESTKIPAAVVLTKGERAGIRSQADGASAGPTGTAWVDSNGWRIRLARLRNPDKVVWVEAPAPKPNEVVRIERYLIGVADAAAYGGRWVIELDPHFRKGVADRDAGALRDWERLTAAVRFFESHSEWADQPARAVLAVLSDFTGPNQFLAQEILNLAARQQLAYLLLDKSKFRELPTGLKAIVYPDGQPPAEELRGALVRFVQTGGLLMAGPSWGDAGGRELPPGTHPRYSVRMVGQGRIALAKDMRDPYLVASDAQVLLSHRNDIVRLWNGGSLGIYTMGDDRRTLVHLVNYTGRPGNDPVSMKVAGRYRVASMHSFENKEAKSLEVIPQKDGVELHLPPISIYAAIEVS